MFLTRSVSADVTVSADPTLLEGFADLIRTGFGMGDSSSNQHTEKRTIVIARMGFADMDCSNRSAHSDITQIDLVVGGLLLKTRKNVVFVSKTDPFARLIPDMHMGSATQSTRREGRHEVSGIEI